MKRVQSREKGLGRLRKTLFSPVTLPRTVKAGGIWSPNLLVILFFCYIFQQDAIRSMYMHDTEGETIYRLTNCTSITAQFCIKSLKSLKKHRAKAKRKKLQIAMAELP